MPESAPAVSVVMPVRDAERFVAAAVDSVLAQSFGDFELIIVDDGSADRTPEILGAYRDPRIRLRRSAPRGIVPALNLGLELARGPYLARMDADDVALPDRLARQVAVLESRPELGALGTAARAIDGAGARGSVVRMPESDGEIRRMLAHGSPLIHPTVLARKSAVERAGGYRSCCTHAEDYDLWLRLAGLCRLANLPAVHLLLRSHPGQVSAVRRLPQRAAAALARRLAAGEPVPVDPEDGTGERALWQALRRYAESLDGNGGARDARAWTDAATIVRALRARGDLSARRGFRLLASGPAAGPGAKAALLAKLVLGR